MIIGGLIFLLGLIFGSFLNAWEYRLETKKTLGGRSFCPKCKKQIAWYDNIPVISWIILRGKCRQCHKPISIQYPTVELATGLLFLSLWLYSASGIAMRDWLNGIYNLQFTIYNQFPVLEFLKFTLLTSSFYLLLLVALYDAKTKYVLSKHTYIAGMIGLVYYLINLNLPISLISLYPYFLAVVIPAGILWLIYKLSKGKAMGEGDSEIALAIGLILGWPKIIPAYYFAFISGALYGLFVLLRKKGGLRSEVPLGPFLVTGALFGFLFGAQIIDWYVKIIFS